MFEQTPWVGLFGAKTELNIKEKNRIVGIIRSKTKSI